MPRTYINNWQRHGFTAGDFLTIKGSKETVEVISHPRYASGLAFKIESSGYVFHSASGLVKYILKKSNINSGWNYLTKGAIPDDSN